MNQNDDALGYRLVLRGTSTKGVEEDGRLAARDIEYRWNLARIKGCEPSKDEEFFSGYRKSHRRMRGQWHRYHCFGCLDDSLVGWCADQSGL